MKAAIDKRRDAQQREANEAIAKQRLAELQGRH